MTPIPKHIPRPILRWVGIPGFDGFDVDGCDDEAELDEGKVLLVVIDCTEGRGFVVTGCETRREVVLGGAGGKRSPMIVLIDASSTIYGELAGTKTVSCEIVTFAPLPDKGGAAFVCEKLIAILG